VACSLDTPELDAAANPVGAPHLRRNTQRQLDEIDRWLGARTPRK